MSALLTGIVCISGCKDKDDNDNECLGNYPVNGFLSHYADNIIVPDYQDFKVHLDELAGRISEFSLLKNSENLDSVRSYFKKTYINWQYVEAYEFGPAEDVFLRSSLNNFPLNESALIAKLKNEDYDFSSPATYDKGFPALDYLFFGYANDSIALLDSFIGEPKLMTYAVKVVEDMKSRTDAVVSKWINEGYLSQFKQNTGLAAGQSFSLVVNSLNENFEILRRKRIGLPSGVLTLNFPNPTEVEGLYSKTSLALAKSSLAASERYFQGDNGEGFDNVLDFIGAKKNGENLSLAITNQFKKAETALEAIPETLSESVTENTVLVVNAYNSLSPLVILLKSDMPSVMCIAITYVDNPSDSD